MAEHAVSFLNSGLGGKLVRVSETSMGWLPNYEASLRPALHQE